MQTQDISFFSEDAKLQLSSLFECICFAFVAKNRNTNRKDLAKDFSISIERIFDVKKMSNAILVLFVGQCDELNRKCNGIVIMQSGHEAWRQCGKNSTH